MGDRKKAKLKGSRQRSINSPFSDYIFIWEILLEFHLYLLLEGQNFSYVDRHWKYRNIQEQLETDRGEDFYKGFSYSGDSGRIKVFGPGTQLIITGKSSIFLE